MRELIRKLYNNSVVRYVFFGGLTTLVNLVSYFLLRTFTPLNMTVANVISIVLAIIFAFITNSKFVFHSEASGWKQHLLEFIKFFSARISTLIIEVAGVALLAYLGMNDLLGKFLTQFIVLVLNYLFSKFLVFKKKDKTLCK